ncbi:carbohydrate porin [Rhizobiales bacterium TNE-4]|nr:carbohydrate porin [Rhizobiales bacterium TNE-4]MBV1827544.1 carbohydrate porin [Rhizobiales bacterium TNE-4]
MTLPKLYRTVIAGVLLGSTPVFGFDNSGGHDHAVHDGKKIEISADSEWRERQNDRRIGRVHDQTRAQRDKELRDEEGANTPYKEYLKFKHWLAQYGITAQLAPSVLNQWGVPSGGKPAFQWILSPSLNWNAFNSQEIGQGSVQFSYSYNRYGNQQSGASLTGRLRAITPVTDTPTNDYTFNQLTYTHVFPGKLLQVSVGQFPFSNFDNNQYAANQQTNFVNYALSQNASQAYVPDSLGGYLQVNLTQTVSVASGFQDANNITGNRIQFSTASKGQYAWFGYAQWKPVIEGFGAAQYSLLYYQQPKVPMQMESAQGWSLNVVQNINKTWGVFVRANTATGRIAPIESSLAAGFIMNNPFGGLQGDQWGVGLAWNKTNKAYFPLQTVRDGEFVAETYLNIVFSKVLQFGPSVQLIVNPALRPQASSAGVFTLRATGLF